MRPVTGQFTTNPGYVWSQYLADYYGTSAVPNGNGQTGPNYAAGGARVGVNSTGALGPIPSLATQMNNYLTANGGRADAHALYTVWGGANDLFAITSGSANPTTTISSADAIRHTPMVSSMRRMRPTMKPPRIMPTALHSMNPVTTLAASVSGIW